MVKCINCFHNKGCAYNYDYKLDNNHSALMIYCEKDEDLPCVCLFADEEWDCFPRAYKPVNA
jgi:hypothetical protein